MFIQQVSQELCLQDDVSRTEEGFLKRKKTRKNWASLVTGGNM